MLRPITNFVVIERDKTPDKTEGGLYMPDNAKEKLTRGKVIAVGRGVRAEDEIATLLEKSVEQLVNSRKTADVTHGDVWQLVETSRMVIQRLRQRAPQVKEGDQVLFGKYTGNEVRVKDREGVERECIVTRDEEIYGVIEQ